MTEMKGPWLVEETVQKAMDSMERSNCVNMRAILVLAFGRSLRSGSETALPSVP